MTRTDLPEFLTSRQVAKLVGAAHVTVNRWCRTGEITAAKTPGGYYRIPTAPLVERFESILSARGEDSDD